MAAKRAEPWLSLLPSALSDDIPNSDLLVTLADMAHIYGAAQSDDTMLRSSLAAYEAHLHVVPDNRAGARMRMETLLRLREYERAFAACDQLLAMALTAADPELGIAQHTCSSVGYVLFECLMNECRNRAVSIDSRR
jgi:hypothetical protein